MKKTNEKAWFCFVFVSTFEVSAVLPECFSYNPPDFGQFSENPPISPLKPAKVAGIRTFWQHRKHFDREKGKGGEVDETILPFYATLWPETVFNSRSKIKISSILAFYLIKTGLASL